MNLFSCRPATRRRGLVAGALAALAPAAHAGIVVELSDPSGLAAEVEFTLVESGVLEVRARNRSTGVPEGFDREDQILTGISWDFGRPGLHLNDPFILAGKVVVGADSMTIDFDAGVFGPGEDVGGEWGFANYDFFGLLPNLITSSRLLAIPFSLENLDGPLPLDGAQGGLVANPVLLPLDGVGAIQDEIVATLLVLHGLDDLAFLDNGVRVEFGRGARHLTSTGGFRFEPPVEIAQTDEPTAVATGDFDGGGDADGAGTQDLVVTVRAPIAGEPGFLVVLLNDGSGAQYLQVQTPVGADPSDVVVADVDGVNGPDAIVTNGGDDTITVLRNDGLRLGTFLPGAVIPVGARPAAIASGDVNGDGAPDLAVANGDDDTVTILLNDGSGDFVALPAIPVGDDPTDVAFGFFDGDGTLDLLVATAGDGEIVLLAGDGLLGFGPVSLVMGARGPGQLGPEDLDGDKDIDYVYAAPGIEEADGVESTFLVALNDGNGGFDAISMPVGPGPTSATTADLDGDGDKEVLVVAGLATAAAGPAQRVIHVFRNLLIETGNLALVEVNQVASDEFLKYVLTDRLDDDAFPDLVAVDAEEGGAPAGSLEVLLGVSGCAADVDRNGDVGMSDLMQLLMMWGACDEPCPPTCTSDLDGDCMVGIRDLIEVLGGWGPCS